MTLTPEEKRAVATTFGIANVDPLWEQSAAVGLPFYISCAIMEKESHGRNVYGNDDGGALEGFPGTPNRSNYQVFRWLIFAKGQKSNGIGPCQITFRGHFTAMEDEGLRPYNVADNMFYGLRLFRRLLTEVKGDIVLAGERYNGSRAYGEDLAVKVQQWKQRIQR